ncbi:MAG TPA: hypothetical protein DCZ92_05055 [Elusimicrobia bacterium]|nr:MAG: hypothetical protein A2016_12755 [Elusimicrobia bacterium GWF2_62_30]HBA60175.1 hypothetical protein [Elusimicrobiota bacterium]
MLRKLLSIVSLPVFFASLSFAQTPAFEDLQPLTAADIQAGVLVSDDLQAQKKWGVSYILNGTLTVNDEKILFNTPDGRIFELDMSRRKARKFNGQTVHLEAKAKQADDMSVLKVSGIEKYDPALHELTLPPYQAKRRRAEVVSDLDGTLTVNNIRWFQASVPAKDSFDWATASIKPELVKNVYFVKKPFAPEWIAAHSLLTFTFEKGGLTDANGNEASGLSLTIEAFLREGQSYGLVSGMKKKFGIVWMLTTWEDYAARTALYDTDSPRLIPYAVNFTHEQKAQMVREAVKLAAVNRDGEFYDTITNNCTNNLVLIMNHVLPENRRMKMWTIPYLVFNLRATMPVWVPAYLQKKGLLGEEMAPVTAANYQIPLP